MSFPHVQSVWIAGPLLLLALSVITWTIFGRRNVVHIHTDFVAKQLLTDNELEFYSRLLDALPNDAIFVQVAMGALLNPSCDESSEDFWRIRSQFAQKFVDFVVCDPSSLDVIAIIELDDRTHDPVKDADRDAMLGAAGFTVLRWQSTHKPRCDEIAQAVDHCRF